jgi:hypothetical protein
MLGAETSVGVRTVATLARVVGVSRATLARRFTDAAREPPIAYLTRTRIGLAAGLLCAPGTTVAAAAPPGRLRQSLRAQPRTQAGARDPPGRAPLTAGRAAHHRAARHRTTGSRLTGLIASP